MEEVRFDPETRPSLLVRLRDGSDAVSWQTFFEIYAPLIYRYCRSRRLQEADAEDVAQEVLAQVARSIRTFEYQPERGRFRDWLGTVTRNRITRVHTRAAHGPGQTSLDHPLDTLIAPEAEGEWTDEFNARLLEVALDRIRPHFEAANWRAFERTWLENAPATDVAVELGLPIDAVYTAKSRALKRLRVEVLLLADDIPSFIPSG
jgi:RNA polymerase sigma factor (sigma-70 family)